MVKSKEKMTKSWDKRFSWRSLLFLTNSLSITTLDCFAMSTGKNPGLLGLFNYLCWMGILLLHILALTASVGDNSIHILLNCEETCSFAVIFAVLVMIFSNQKIDSIRCDNIFLLAVSEALMNTTLGCPPNLDRIGVLLRKKWTQYLKYVGAPLSLSLGTPSPWKTPSRALQSLKCKTIHCQMQQTVRFQHPESACLIRGFDQRPLDSTDVLNDLEGEHMLKWDSL